MHTIKVFFIVLLLDGSGHALAQDMVRVPAGRYESFVPERKTPGAPLQAPVISLAAFDIDRTPVTNAQFLNFLRQQPGWERGRASRLFTDASYLSHWQDSLSPGSQAPRTSPAVQISWFAARAYCQAQGKRLPTTYEWEYVASPEFYGSTAADRETFLRVILEWYAKPSAPVLPAVGQTAGHRLGVQDLHGLIWEWTQDFNSNMVGADLRDDASPEAAAFCGAATLGGQDPTNYASYMRFAFRSSLKGGFSLANLGFRCARDAAP